ncbi:MAG: 50S ribosomal protein L23 [Phycisphaeraceae bacterium]|jgi:large subunit ribosomal protein L23
MEPTHVIKRPLITEKSTFEASGSIPRGKRAGQPLNRYAFEVDMKARKGDIAKAIEAIYNVRVEKVNTQIRKGQYFRTRFGPGKTSQWKKALVTLHDDDRIDLF